MLLILFDIRTRRVVLQQILWPSQFTQTWPKRCRVRRHFDEVSCRYPRTLYHCEPRTSTRNDVIPSVDASKVYFVASLLTQYWLACKLTCTKRNFDTRQSVTDITAAIGTPWLHKLWLGLVLTTGRASITMLVLTLVDWWLCLWPSAKLQPNFGFKMKLSCRDHDHALHFALFRVT